VTVQSFLDVVRQFEYSNIKLSDNIARPVEMKLFAL